MRWRVSRRTLLLIAGLVWIIAGANILRIGIITWVDDQREWLFKTGEAIVVFLLFFSLIFRRLYNKHTERIGQKADRNCPFSFFDVKGWLIMGFMITLGILVRKLHLLPTSFIAVFYTGLSSALILTGILFLVQWQKTNNSRRSDSCT